MSRPDGYLIRRRAVEAAVPLITDLQLARALIDALRRRGMNDLSVLSWQECMGRNDAPHMASEENVPLHLLSSNAR